MEKLSYTFCDICRAKGVRSKVRTICKECREFYCKDCSDSHALLKITRDHVLIDLTSSHCDICQMKGVKATVRTICRECREFYCQDCSHTHSIMKLTRDHPLIDLDPHDCQDSPKRQDTPLMTSESDAMEDANIVSPRPVTTTDSAQFSSDFLGNLMVRENTVMYQAQVAIGGRKKSAKKQEPPEQTPVITPFQEPPEQTPVITPFPPPSSSK